jgi:hypothetical protein
MVVGRGISRIDFDHYHSLLSLLIHLDMINGRIDWYKVSYFDHLFMTQRDYYFYLYDPKQ